MSPRVTVSRPASAPERVTSTTTALPDPAITVSWPARLCTAARLPVRVYRCAAAGTARSAVAPATSTRPRAHRLLLRTAASAALSKENAERGVRDGRGPRARPSPAPDLQVQPVADLHPILRNSTCTAMP